MAARSNGKGFLLRIDPETMSAVEKWAADEFRSVNGQLQWIIADALKRHGRRTRTTLPAGEATSRPTHEGE